MAAFARTIGIDYSGAETPTASLKGLRAYIADGDGFPMPKVFGRNAFADLQVRKAFASHGAPPILDRAFDPQLETRQNTFGDCGPTANGAVCAEDYCCGDMVVDIPLTGTERNMMH